MDRGVMSPLLLFIFFYVVAVMEVSEAKCSNLSLCAPSALWNYLRSSLRVGVAAVGQRNSWIPPFKEHAHGLVP